MQWELLRLFKPSLGSEGDSSRWPSLYTTLSSLTGVSDSTQVVELNGCKGDRPKLAVIDEGSNYKVGLIFF